MRVIEAEPYFLDRNTPLSSGAEAELVAAGASPRHGLLRIPATDIAGQVEHFTAARACRMRASTCRAEDGSPHFAALPRAGPRHDGDVEAIFAPSVFHPDIT